MTDREALKLALEALETELCIDWTNNDEFNASAEKMHEAIAAIEEALAQPVQLVAHREAFWCVDLTCKKCYSADFRFKHKSSVDKKSLTTPAQPEERPWVGLTDYEIGVCSTEAAMNRSEMVGGAVTFARAIEAKLKEKNT